MAYDEDLDLKLRAITEKWGCVRKKMFGGTCYLLGKKMLCGVYKDFLILRLGEESATRLLGKEGARPFDITGRPMKGWLMMPSIYEGAVLGIPAIEAKVELAKSFVDGLP
jgi:TfoX/Sxy family transcriptional regulator of competence genes